MARVAVEFAGNEHDAVRAADRVKRAIGGIDDQARTTSRQTSSEMRSLEQSVSRTASGIERSLGRAARVGLFAIGAGAAAAAGGVGLLGLSFYRTQQSASIAFRTMLGDGGKAKRFLDELAAFARKTPFEFPDLIRSTQKMMAMGFEAKKVIPILTDVGNKVAAMGGDPQIMEQTIRALGQVRSRGKLMAEEMNQFIDAGTFGWLQLAEAIGVPTSKIQDLTRRGLIDFDTFLKAFQHSAEGVGGMMDEQSRSFTGLLSTLKDNVSEASATTLTPFFEMVERGMARVNRELGSPEGQEGVRRLAGFVEHDLVPALQRTVDWVVENRDQIAAMGRDGAAALGGLLQALQETGGALKRIADLVGGWDQLFLLLLSGRLALAVKGLAVQFGLLAGAQTAAGVAGGVGIAGAAGWATRLLGTLRAISILGAAGITIKMLFTTGGGQEDRSLAEAILFGEKGKTTPELILDWARGQVGLSDDAQGTPTRQGPPSGRPGTGVSGGTARQGIQLPTSQRATHDTDGLPGWDNAVDYFGKVGTPILAPEDGAIVRHSGRGGSTGKQVYGWSIYYDGYETGNSYYITHLQTRGAIGNYKKGDVIGTISAWAAGDPHAHVGIKPGGATTKPGSTAGQGTSAADLVGDPAAGATTTRTAAQTAAQRARTERLERLAEATGLRRKFGTLAGDARDRLAGFDKDTTAEILALIQAGNLTISRAFKDKLITKNELGAIDAAFERLQDRLEKGVEKVREAFERSWDRFRNLLDKALTELGPSATLERRRQGLVASDATALIQQVLGSGDVSEQERQVQYAAERVQRAWKAYTAAVTSGSRQATEEAAAELAEAEKRFESLDEQDLQERAQRLFGAYRDLIGVVSSQEQQLWDTMSDEQQQAVDDLLEKVQEQLAAGKIGYAQARQILTAELQKLGIDIENIGGLLGEPFQQAMIKALTGIETAVNRLIAALRGVRAESDAISGPAPTRGGSVIPDLAGGLGPSRLLSSVVRPVSTVGSVTPVPVRQTAAGRSQASLTFAPTIAPSIHIGTVVGGGDDVAEQIAQVATSAIRNELARTQQQIGIHGKLFAV